MEVINISRASSVVRVKLFLDIATTNIDQVDDCCKENLLNNEDDIELTENCFEESSNLNTILNARRYTTFVGILHVKETSCDSSRL